MRGYKVVTLGCKANQYDSDLIAQALRSAGLSASETPDVVVLNTCAVTSRAEAKGRRMLRRLCEKHPASRIIVTGCAAERLRVPAGVAVVPQGAADAIPALLGLDVEIVDCLRTCRPGRGRTRVFVKVQDGCDAFCSYCVIPYVRGKPRSKPPKLVKSEVAHLVELGHREVVLTGIHLGAYGRDLDASQGGTASLEGLVRELLGIPGTWRLRLSSVEAGEVSAGLLDLASHPHFCPHFHLPLQSGDDEILRLMNRPLTAGQFRAVVERIRAAVPNPGLTTDVIVGFPGETEARFERTYRLVAELAFTRLHVFPFDPRPGTRAFSLPDRPQSGAVKERVHRLISLGNELMASFAERFVGSTVAVLAEPAGNGLGGYSERYVRVRFPGDRSLVGNLVNVRIRGVGGPVAEGALAQ